MLEIHKPNGLHSGLLPRDLNDRDDFVGVTIIRTGDYQSVRFSVSTALLKKIGKPERVAIRGTPANGYLISAGADIKPTMVGASKSRAYINIAVDKVGAPHSERQTVWIRAEIDDKRIRIPPLPPAWISGDPEFLAGAVCEETDRQMSISKTPGDDAVRVSSTSAPVALTVPPAKAALDYKLPDNMGIAEAQALLGRKLDEARAILRELEKRSGLRMTLTRNFQITLDLSGK